MVTEKHLARKKIMLEWAEGPDCPADMKESLIAQWTVDPQFPAVEKAIWAGTREALKDVKNSPINDMKNIDAVRAEMGEDVLGLEMAFIAIHAEFGEHIHQRGKDGVYALYDSDKHYAEVMVTELINRKRKA